MLPLSDAPSLREPVRLSHGRVSPIPMILFCPACGLQHIDKPDTHDQAADKLLSGKAPWDNPPHRSHLCAGCGHVWRPADVETEGVSELPSGRLGERDTRPAIRTIADTSARKPPGGDND